MKILNLYACLGGNRYKWDEVAKEAGIEIQVTAVELDPELARLYQERFPNDIVIIADAHQYLLEHYKEFDFIWSSPPCPTHSKINISQKNIRKMKFPDMKLYEEIIFLDNWFEGKYVVENVIPYYDPLVPAKKKGRHLYWTNFNLPTDLMDRRFAISQTKNELKELCKFHEIDVSTYNGSQSLVKIGRNLVDYEAGRTIFQTVLNITSKQNTEQLELTL
jgi:DNA (cytosine-5)-methyltransferase 1